MKFSVLKSPGGGSWGSIILGGDHPARIPMSPIVRLPQPGEVERAHGARLEALIREEIAARGPISFERFMQLALYAPGLGYYSAGKAKFGAAGDFVTASELGSLFARCTARAIAPALRATGGDVLELGAGSGALARDVLAELAALDALPRAYRILETSADLRQRQAAAVATLDPALAARVAWLDAPPVQPWNGVLFANEVLDALPLRAFAARGTKLSERCVAHDGTRLAWHEAPADDALRAAVAAIRAELDDAWPTPYRSEVCTTLAPWLAEVTRTLARGLALFVDYGYPRREYYMPQRNEGTLVCHYRHRAHDDPLILVGLQDITAFVDFTAVAHGAHAAGLELAAYLSQSQFLFASGLAELLERAQKLPDVQRYPQLAEAKRLTLPGEMGERFKAIAFVRGLELAHVPFAVHDQSHRL